MLMRRGLSTIDHDQRTMLVGQARHVSHRIDRPQRVGNMVHRHQPGTLADQVAIGSLIQHAALVYRNHLDGEPQLAGQQLPGHDVGVMLQARYQHLVAGA